MWDERAFLASVPGGAQNRACICQLLPKRPMAGVVAISRPGPRRQRRTWSDDGEEPGSTANSHQKREETPVQHPTQPASGRSSAYKERTRPQDAATSSGSLGSVSTPHGKPALLCKQAPAYRGSHSRLRSPRVAASDVDRNLPKLASWGVEMPPPSPLPIYMGDPVWWASGVVGSVASNERACIDQPVGNACTSSPRLNRKENGVRRRHAAQRGTTEAGGRMASYRYTMCLP